MASLKEADPSIAACFTSTILEAGYPAPSELDFWKYIPRENVVGLMQHHMRQLLRDPEAARYMRFAHQMLFHGPNQINTDPAAIIVNDEEIIDNAGTVMGGPLSDVFFDQLGLREEIRQLAMSQIGMHLHAIPWEDDLQNRLIQLVTPLVPNMSEDVKSLLWWNTIMNVSNPYNHQELAVDAMIAAGINMPNIQTGGIISE